MLKALKRGREIKKGDYLFVGRSLYASDFRERAGRTDFPGVCSNGIIAIREKPDVIIDGFLASVLNQKEIWDFVVKNATGTLTRYVYWKTLKNYEFMLPPKEEQQRIVIALNTSMLAYDSMLEAATKFETVCNAKLQTLFSSSNRKKLSEFVEKVTKGTTPTSLGFDYVEEGVPFLRAEDILNKEINIQNCKKSVFLFYQNVYFSQKTKKHK